MPALVTGLQHRKSGGFVHRSVSGFPAGFSHFQGRSLAVALAGRLVWFLARSVSLAALYITGVLDIAIDVPFESLTAFYNLWVI